MTLTLYDSKNRRVTESNPVRTEHNGTQGETDTVDLYLANESRDFRHRQVRLKAVSQAPVDIKLKKQGQGPTFLSTLEWDEIGPGERAPFQARVTIPPGQEAQVLTDSRFVWESNKYPIS